MLRIALGSVVFSGLVSLAACSSDATSAPPPGGAGAPSAGAPGGAGSPSGAGSSSAGATNAGAANGGSSSAGAANAGSSNAGSAGAAAGSGSAGAGSAGAPAACALCDDFEGVAPGMPPDPSKWTATVLADCMSNANPKPVIDAAQHHGGAQSLKVTGTDNYCNYAMVGNSTAFKAVGNVVYGRYFIRFETALPPGHTAFMILPDTNIKSLRMGGQNSAFQWNRQSDDATLPSQSPAGIALSKVPPVGQWTCIEFMVDQAQGLINTWVDDALIGGLVADATPTADVDMAWGTAYKPALTGVNIGWQNYGGGAMNLWFDDFALSSSRIHCQ